MFRVDAAAPGCRSWHQVSTDGAHASAASPVPRGGTGAPGGPPGRAPSRASPLPVEQASLLASADDLWSLALRLGAPVLAVRRGGGHTEPIVEEGQAGPAEGRL